MFRSRQMRYIEFDNSSLEIYSLPWLTVWSLYRVLRRHPDVSAATALLNAVADTTSSSRQKGWAPICSGTRRGKEISS
jgi:hypothetical protein